MCVVSVERRLLCCPRFHCTHLPLPLLPPSPVVLRHLHSSVTMGNIPGMPEIPTPEIKEIAEQTMKTFTPIYVKSYGIGLINKLKRQVLLVCVERPCCVVWSGI